MNRGLVVVLGAVPPPMGGAAKITGIIASELARKQETEILNTSVGQLAHTRSLMYHIRRLFRTFFCAWRLYSLAERKNKALYTVPDGGFGMVYTLIYSVVARLSNYTIYCHHHTFRYINNFSLMMFLFRKILRGKEKHIFLSHGMMTQYELKYGSVPEKYVVDNSYYVLPEKSVQHGSGPLVLGHLSNLCDEKGFYEAVAVFENLAAKGTDIRLKIAGKSLNAAVTRKLQMLANDWKGRVDYLGHIDGEDKDEFYRSIDVFLFPTKFKQEAQPMVIYEAMAKGCACVSWERGCIREMYSDLAGIVIPLNEDYITNAVIFVQKLKDNQALLFEYKRNALSEIIERRECAMGQFDTMINTITDFNKY